MGWNHSAHHSHMTFSLIHKQINRWSRIFYWIVQRDFWAQALLTGLNQPNESFTSYCYFLQYLYGLTLLFHHIDDVGGVAAYIKVSQQEWVFYSITLTWIDADVLKKKLSLSCLWGQQAEGLWFILLGTLYALSTVCVRGVLSSHIRKETSWEEQSAKLT